MTAVDFAGDFFVFGIPQNPGGTVGPEPILEKMECFKNLYLKGLIIGL